MLGPSARHAGIPLTGLAVAIVLVSTTFSAHPVLAAAPLCDGRTATIYEGQPGSSFAGGVWTFIGTSADDVIAGTPGNDVINAGSGDDVICGFDGDDTLRGQNGDIVVFDAADSVIAGGTG